MDDDAALSKTWIMPASSDEGVISVAPQGGLFFIVLDFKASMLNRIHDEFDQGGSNVKTLDFR